MLTNDIELRVFVLSYLFITVALLDWHPAILCGRIAIPFYQVFSLKKNYIFYDWFHQNCLCYFAIELLTFPFFVLFPTTFSTSKLESKSIIIEFLWYFDRNTKKYLKTVGIISRNDAIGQFRNSMKFLVCLNWCLLDYVRWRNERFKARAPV